MFQSQEGNDTETLELVKVVVEVALRKLSVAEDIPGEAETQLTTEVPEAIGYAAAQVA